MGNLLATFCWALLLLLVNVWLYSFVIPTGAVPSVDTSAVVDSPEVLASSVPPFATFHFSTVVSLSPSYPLSITVFTPLPCFPSHLLLFLPSLLQLSLIVLCLFLNIVGVSPIFLALTACYSSVCSPPLASSSVVLISLGNFCYCAGFFNFFRVVWLYQLLQSLAHLVKSL